MQRRTSLWIGGAALLATAACVAVVAPWGEPRTYLPPSLRVAEILAENDEGGLREGCVYGLYRLHPDTVSSLRTHGLAFLGTDSQPQGQSGSNPYSGWYQTPLEVDSDHRARIDRGAERLSLHALSATSCGPRTNPYRRTAQAEARSVNRALETAGNFYSVSANREGMIVVDPANGLAWFLYFG